MSNSKYYVKRAFDMIKIYYKIIKNIKMIQRLKNLIMFYEEKKEENRE